MEFILECNLPAIKVSIEIYGENLSQSDIHCLSGQVKGQASKHTYYIEPYKILHINSTVQYVSGNDCEKM